MLARLATLLSRLPTPPRPVVALATVCYLMITALTLLSALAEWRIAGGVELSTWLASIGLVAVGVAGVTLEAADRAVERARTEAERRGARREIERLLQEIDKG